LRGLLDRVGIVAEVRRRTQPDGPRPTARASVTYGQRTRRELSFGEPYFLDYRLAFGIDLFAKQIDSSRTTRTGRRRSAALPLGIPLREDWRFSCATRPIAEDRPRSGPAEL